MADSPLFEWVCAELAAATSFSEIESRGTVRIALKKGGLAADQVRSSQMQVVVKRVLPDELRRRGCTDGQQVCDELARRLVEQGFEESGGAGDGSSPESVFARLGGTA